MIKSHRQINLQALSHVEIQFPIYLSEVVREEWLCLPPPPKKKRRSKYSKRNPNRSDHESSTSRKKRKYVRMGRWRDSNVSKHSRVFECCNAFLYVLHNHSCWCTFKLFTYNGPCETQILPNTTAGSSSMLFHKTGSLVKSIVLWSLLHQSLGNHLHQAHIALYTTHQIHSHTEPGRHEKRY